jgi:heme-degrading monooxygenase HmoA
MPVPALLEMDVVVGADAGLHRELLAPQAADAAPARRRQSYLRGLHVLAPGAQELAEQVRLGVHGRRASRALRASQLPRWGELCVLVARRSDSKQSTGCMVVAASMDKPGGATPMFADPMSHTARAGLVMRDSMAYVLATSDTDEGEVIGVIQFQVKQKVTAESRAAFEDVVQRLFIPAITAQKGFISFRMLEEFPVAVRDEIGATTDGFHLVIQLTFETEDDRRNWVATPAHDEFGRAVAGLVSDAHYTGYQVLVEQTS